MPINKTLHCINLTNGIEALRDISSKHICFIRIQSTVCEQKDWDRLIMDLDNNFLMHLALGSECKVYDFSNKRDTPRAVWQGIEFVKYALHTCWFGITIECPKTMHHYFKEVYETLKKPSLNKLKYYRKFLLTKKINITVETKQTTHDGDYNWYLKELQST